MTSTEPQLITSGGNAFYKELRRLAQDSTAYRRQGRIWLEGDHLCRAALQRGVRPQTAVFQESFWARAPADWGRAASRTIVLADNLFAGLSALESPGLMGFIVDVPQGGELRAGVASVVLDGLQDPGNVGSILRCASAFGFGQVLAMRGTAALWSPKVLRAGMGAHFGLHLLENLLPDDVLVAGVPLLVTSSHGGEALHRAELPWPCAWVFGHEGQGVSAGMQMRADLSVRIIQPGGEESLNAAAAAAICLHASAAGQAR